MSTPLLVEFFNALPEDALRGGLDWPIQPSLGEEPPRPAASGKSGGKARRRAAIHVFCKQVQERYFQGTIVRLLESTESRTRQAAVFALGLVGTADVNACLAGRLRDDDDEVARQASEALWTLWFRGNDTAHSDELYRALRLRDRSKVLAALDELIARAPEFAEAYNQRAVLFFRLEQFDRSIADCQTTLRLNPYHFGAQAGLGQCYLRLRKHRSALRAFRSALRINPRLAGIAEAVRALENSLGEEGR